MNPGARPTRADVVREALEWEGTPFVHQGMVKGVGCDCVGVVAGVGINTQVLEVVPSDPVFDGIRAYSRKPDPSIMRAALRTAMLHIRKDEAGAGDVLYRRYGGDPQHLGILTGPVRDSATMVVHAVRWPYRRVVVHTIDDEWARLSVSAWRYPRMGA